MQAWDGFGEDAGIKGRGNSMADNEGIFRDAQHKKFYSHYLNKCGCSDPHHKALVTALGLMGIQGGTSMISMILARGASTRDACMGAGRQTAVGKLPGLLLPYTQTGQ